MKLLRVGQKGKEKPAVIDDQNNYKDLSSVIEDLNPKTLNFETLKKIKNTDLSKLPTIDVNQRIGACVSEPSKFIGIGLNFKDIWFHRHKVEKMAKKYSFPIVPDFLIFDQITFSQLKLKLLVFRRFYQNFL